MPAVASNLTIGQVARRAGLQTSAIRYYEAIGLLHEPERVAGQRRYSAEVLDWLVLIEVAQRAGFSLAETRTLLEGFHEGTNDTWRILATAKLSELDELIARATAMKELLEDGLRCDCLELEDGAELFSCCVDWARDRQAPGAAAGTRSG